MQLYCAHITTFAEDPNKKIGPGIGPRTRAQARARSTGGHIEQHLAAKLHMGDESAAGSIG
jgi:hypothetical protein